MSDERAVGRPHKRIGCALFAVGSIASMMAGKAAWHAKDREVGIVCTVICLLAIPLTSLGFNLIWRARQYASRANAQRVFSAIGPRVLYLRPFQSDAIRKKLLAAAENPQTALNCLSTEEEGLAAAVGQIGDLVAIGRPGEALPTPGAARLYASEDEWKEVVREQLKTARLVIIRAGVGENVLWELNEAARTVPPEKLLILAIMKRREYEAFRTKAESILGMSFRNVGPLRPGFIGFDHGWVPYMLPLRAPLWRGSLTDRWRPLFKLALRPAFERLGVEWQPPPVSKATVCLFGGLSLVFAFVGVLLIIPVLKDRPQYRADETPAPESSLATSDASAPTDIRPGFFRGRSVNYSLILGGWWREIERAPEETFDRGFQYGDHLRVFLWGEQLDPDPARSITVERVEGLAIERMSSIGYQQVELSASGVDSGGPGQYAWAEVRGSEADSSGSAAHQLCIFPFEWGNLIIDIWGHEPAWSSGDKQRAVELLAGLR